MRILALDTSTHVIAVAVCRDGAPLAETWVDADRAHSERLLETVGWVLREAALDLNALDALAVSVGPGSFTGLRVGVAAAKGLALGANLPLIGVPTLDALSRLAAGYDGVVVPLLDARMQEVFGARYRFVDGQRTIERTAAVGPVEDFLDDLPERVHFLGDGARLYADRIQARVPGALFAPALHNMPRASAVALEAEALAQAGPLPDSATVAPVYLRLSQPEEKRRRETQASA